MTPKITIKKLKFVLKLIYIRIKSSLNYTEVTTLMNHIKYSRL